MEFKNHYQVPLITPGMKVTEEHSHGTLDAKSQKLKGVTENQPKLQGP